jgi:hypothetical protein
MKDKYGIFDLGVDESQPEQHRLISPEFRNAQEALRRLKGTFNEHHRLPQVYAVKNISTGQVIGNVYRNAAARKAQAAVSREGHERS